MNAKDYRLRAERAETELQRCRKVLADPPPTSGRVSPGPAGRETVTKAVRRVAFARGVQDQYEALVALSDAAQAWARYLAAGEPWEPDAGKHEPDRALVA